MAFTAIGDGSSCVQFFSEPFSQPFSCPASSVISSSPFSSLRVSSERVSSRPFSSPASLPPSSLPKVSWRAPSSEAHPGCRHRPTVLRAQVLAQVPALAPRESRRLPLRERVLLPLLPLLPNPLPAIRRRRRCHCTHPSHRPDHTESDH